MKANRVSMLAIVGLLAAGCASTGQQKASEAPKPPAPEVKADAAAKPPIKLLAWNDFHSAIYETKIDDRTALGGLPVFMAAIEKTRGDGLSLLIDGGDMFQGAMPFNESKGMGMIDMMNALKIDAAVLGNHEFDFGEGHTTKGDRRGALIDAVDASNFPWVTSNIVCTDPEAVWPPKNLKPYTMIEKGPYKIAVIGVVTADTATATKTENVVGIEFKSPAESIKALMPEIVAQNPDYVIVDGHITGLPVPMVERGETVINATFDGETGEILALPPEILKDIDLVLTAHSHKSFIAHQGDVTVIQSLWGGREFTEMMLVADDTGLHLDRESIKKHYLLHQPIDAGCGEVQAPAGEIKVGDLMLTPSAKGQEIIKKYEGLMKEDRCEVVACAAEPLGRSRTGECPLGNLVADSLLANYPDAEIVMQNAGGVRINLAAGKIYRETLNALMPFDNYAYYVEMKGSDVADILKYSSTLEHGPMKVSGLRYTLDNGCKNPEDLNRDGKIEEWENNCLCGEVLVNGKPLDKDRMYRVVTSDFIFKGGDGLGIFFKDSKVIDKGPVIKKTIYNHVKSFKECLTKDMLMPPDNPRIINASCGGNYYK